MTDNDRLIERLQETLSRLDGESSDWSTVYDAISLIGKQEKSLDHLSEKFSDLKTDLKFRIDDLNDAFDRAGNP